MASTPEACAAPSARNQAGSIPPTTAQGPINKAALVIGLVLLAGGCAWALYQHLTAPAIPYDDAFITFRYVDNALAGKGLVYNEDQHVMGCSSPLHLLTLIAARSLVTNVPTPLLAVRLNAVFFLATGVGVYLLVRRLVANPLWAGLAAAATLFNRTAITVSMGGMESYFFSALMVFALLAAAQRRTVLFGVLAGLTILARPEGVLLAAIGVAAFRQNSRRLGLSAGIVAAVAAAWFVPAWVYYGSPIPQSILAKAQPLYPLPALYAVRQLLIELRGWMWGYATPLVGDVRAVVTIVLVLATAIVPFAMARLRRRMAYLPAIMLLAMVAIYAAGNPMFFPWYWPPVLMCAMLTMIVALAGLSEAGIHSREAASDLGKKGCTPANTADVAPASSMGNGPAKGEVSPAGGQWASLLRRSSFGCEGWMGNIGLILLVAAWLGYTAFAPYRSSLDGLTPAAAENDHSVERLRIQSYRQAAELINTLSDGRQTLAGPEIGSLGYYFRGKVFDACGLVSPEAMPYLPVPDESRAGPFVGAICAEFVQATNPDWVVTLPLFACYGSHAMTRSLTFADDYVLYATIKLSQPLWKSDQLLIYRRKK